MINLYISKGILSVTLIIYRLIGKILTTQSYFDHR